jgi:amidase
MHGTVGVAPAGFEARSTLTCDTHGGNMDTPEIRPGATLYLGVNVHGALFSLGDGHARQGEGEACGVAVETAMTTVLVVDLIKGATTPWPRLETDTHLMSIGCARPLEDAYRIAHTDLTGWTAALTGLDILDAYQLISQAGQAPVGNVCDPNYTLLASIAKRWLPTHSAYNDAHKRLRAAATDLTGPGPG